jgi:hypothetical protein
MPGVQGSGLTVALSVTESSSNFRRRDPTLHRSPCMASRHVHNRTSLEQDIQAPQRSNFVRSICDRRAGSSTAAVLVTDGFKEFRLIRLIRDYLYDG